MLVIYIILAGVIFFEMCNCIATYMVWKSNEKYLGHNMITDYNIYNILLKMIQNIVIVVFV